MKAYTVGERSLRVAKALDAALAGALREPYAGAVARFEAARMELLSLAATKWEREEVERRIAEALLLLACRTESWETVRSAFAVASDLKFSNVDRHVQDAANVARWCIDHRSHVAEAVAHLQAARSRVVRLPTGSRLRRRLAKQLDELLDAAARIVPASPSHPSGGA